ncbi:DUF4365 domain-containing protein [Sinorhizobium meliloti]|uniref:DUF4365 domain-containing protein n=1 Tax=Rhizobium meliloti TaxID=382 RepID=A0A6A7ZZ67_RHIML|nr:DUF4365 domain-containing protein [Sinorhizobium meliloti]
MPVRTRSQKIGDKGQNQVREQVDAHPHWRCRFQDLDYGVDLEAEYAPAEGDGQRPAGKLLRLQVKATESADARGQVVHVAVERSFLSYALQFRLPVILVHVDVTTRSAWWLWLQAWALEHEERLASSPDNATITVHIPPAASSLRMAVEGNDHQPCLFASATCIAPIQGIREFLHGILPPPRARPDTAVFRREDRAQIAFMTNGQSMVHNPSERFRR